METYMENGRFREISGPELKEINGGGLGTAIVAGIVGAVVVTVLGDWDNFKRGLMGAPEITT